MLCCNSIIITVRKVFYDPCSCDHGLNDLLTTLSLLFQNGERFNNILNALKLQKRGAGGVDTQAEGGLFDISNADRLGHAEVSDMLARQFV